MNDNLSFFATLKIFDYELNLIEELYKNPLNPGISFLSGGWFTGKDTKIKDHSTLLGARPTDPSARTKELKLYFQHTTDGYVLHIKSRGKNYKKIISRQWTDILGATDSNNNDPTKFTILDHQNNPITLKNLPDTHTAISLMTDNKKGVCITPLRGSPYFYLANNDLSPKATFLLSIYKRNVPFSG